MINLTLTTSVRVGKTRAQDGYKALLTWEWTARDMNLNSAELLLNWPLCVETPDGKCVSPSKCHERHGHPFLNTVSRTLRRALSCCCSQLVDIFRQADRIQNNTDAELEIGSLIFSFPYKKGSNCSPCKSSCTVLNHCFFAALGNASVSNQLKFQGWKTKSA